MGVTDQAPRGGVREALGSRKWPMVLQNREIERFEDNHRGIFDIWDGFFGRSDKPNSTEIRDLVALGLIGAGMDDEAADRLLSALGPAHNMHLYKVAQGLVGVAFFPDSAEGGGDEPDPDVDRSQDEKKTHPAPGE